MFLNLNLNASFLNYYKYRLLCFEAGTRAERLKFQFRSYYTHIRYRNVYKCTRNQLQNQIVWNKPKIFWFRSANDWKVSASE